MKQRFKSIRVLLLLLSVLVVGQQQAQAQGTDQVVDRLRAKYGKVNTLRAEFTQTISSEAGGDAQTLAGTLYLQGGKYRVESPRQTYVTDGKVIWIYNADERQVLVNDNVHDETTFSPNDFIFHFDDHYQATGVRTVNVSGQKQYMLSLKPKLKDSVYRDVTLWVRSDDLTITRLDVIDVNGAKVTISLKDIQLNPKLSDSLFTFKAPKGVEVVDLRS